MSVLPHGTRTGRTRTRDGVLGGTSGNETLTRSTAALLTLLLLAEGITVLDVGGMLSLHMLIGLVLIPPVLLKLASTGYRMVRFYTGAAAYRMKGPPALPLRVLAPVLVAATVGIFASGLALLALGHRSDVLLTVHKASFIVWGVVFAMHFLAYLPRVLRSFSADWGVARRAQVPGRSLRAALLAAALGGGAALALTLLPAITDWVTRAGGG
jgi:hypothetical protein